MDPHSSKPCCSRVSCLCFKLWQNIPENEYTTVPLAMTQWVDGATVNGAATGIAHRPSLHRCSSCREETTQWTVWTTSCRCFTFPRTTPSKPVTVSHRSSRAPDTWRMCEENQSVRFTSFLQCQNGIRRRLFPVKFNFTSVGQTNTCPLIIAVPKLLSLYCRTHVHMCTVTGRTRVPVSGMTCEHITSPRGLSGLIQCEWCFLGTDRTL